MNHLHVSAVQMFFKAVMSWRMVQVMLAVQTQEQNLEEFYALLEVSP